MKPFIIFCSLLFVSIAHEKPTAFMKAFNKEAYQWIGIPEKGLQIAFDYCKFEEFQDDLMALVSTLETNNQNFTSQSLQLIEYAFKKNSSLQRNIKCLSSFSHTKIPFLEQKKKVSIARKYILQYPQYSQKVFHQNYTAEHKGKQLGKWIKGLMEYYYVTFISESETLSTVLLRSLSTKAEVLENRDFSFCIDLQDAGKLSQELQNMDINNIFLKIPAAFNVLKYLHLKAKCQSQHNIQIVRNLQDKIKDIDMFKIMYYEYEPYVTIATQKYGISKIKLLATCISQIINNAEEVRRKQIITLEEEERQKQQKANKENTQL